VWLFWKIPAWPRPIATGKSLAAKSPKGKPAACAKLYDRLEAINGGSETVHSCHVGLVVPFRRRHQFKPDAASLSDFQTHMCKSLTSTDSLAHTLASLPAVVPTRQAHAVTAQSE